jgi:Spy/CpxP family protein refolding chaperone
MPEKRAPARCLSHFLNPTKELAMSRLPWLTVLALTACFLSTGSTWAQSGGDSGSEGFGLLRVQQVQRELKLTDEQKVQILALSMELRENRGNLSKKLSDILKPEQLQRLKEIRLQVEGPAALNSHEVAMKLGLNREQRTKLKAIQDEIRQAMQEAMQGLKDLTVDERREKMPELLEKMRRVRTETTEAALNVLTAEQKKDFEKLQGTKVDLGPPPPGPSE